MVDISNFTVAKILDERPSQSGIKYRCELEPAVVSCRLDGKGEDGTRSYPKL
jgi:hypothetical protein